MKVSTAVTQEFENSSLRVIILYQKTELAREAALEIKGIPPMIVSAHTGDTN